MYLYMLYYHLPTQINLGYPQHTIILQKIKQARTNLKGKPCEGLPQNLIKTSENLPFCCPNEK